jgi:hypothetical protein
MPTLYCVTVDTEEEWDWNSGWPRGKPSLANIAQLPQFQSLCDRHMAAVTYFVNHAVLCDEVARSTIAALSASPRVEIGMHIHPWNTPPVQNGPPIAPRESFLANLPEELIVRKLQTVLDAFHTAQLRPTSFRGGRYSSGPFVQDFLRSNGFLADSSVVPFTTWDDDGAPNYRHRDPFPNRIEATGGQSPLWEIPLTLGFTRQPQRFWAATFQTVQRTGLGRLRLIGIADRLNLVRRVWLSFEDPLGNHMQQFLRVLRNMQLPSIVFSLHSSSLVAGANGCYSCTQKDLERLYEQIDATLALLADWPEFQPATISDIARNLEANYARSRN